MIKKESAKPKGFKNTPHLKAPARKTLPIKTDVPDKPSGGGSLILAFIGAVLFIGVFLFAFWPKHTTQVNLTLDTTLPISTLSKDVERETSTTSYTFTYGQGHEESMTLTKDDSVAYLGDDVNAKGSFETYYIESTTDAHFKSMKNALVNVNIAKIQNNAEGKVRFHFNPGKWEDGDIENENIFGTPKDLHREIYLSIK